MYKEKDYYTPPFRRRTGARSSIYYYYAYDEKGKRVLRSTGKRTRGEAMSVIQRRIENGDLIYPKGYAPRKRLPPAERPKATITFGEYADEGRFFIWDECPIIRDAHARKRSFKKKTAKTYRETLMLHVLPHFKDVRLRDIDAHSIDEWLLDLHRTDKVSNSTANLCLACISRILDRAAFEDLIPANPAKGIKRLGKDSKDRGIPSVEEMGRILDIPWKNEILRLGCKVASLTGLRIAEVAGLMADDIFPDRIVISGQYSKLEKDKVLTKNTKERVCPIPLSLYNELLPYLHDGYVFSRDGKRPYSDESFRRAFYEAMKAAGISEEEREDRNIVFHSLRHFANTRMVAGGVRPEVTRAAIGHADEAMTEHYLHLDASDMGDIRRVQEALLAREEDPVSERAAD